MMSRSSYGRLQVYCGQAQSSVARWRVLAKNVRVELVRNVPRDAVLVDLDCPYLPGSVKNIRANVREILHGAGYYVKGIQVIPSRRHTHIICTVRPRPVSIYEKIALQLLLGSDRFREANNLRRVQALPVLREAGAMLNVLYEPQ